MAAFGPMTLSEVGTSFADILTALPIIAGVALMFAGDEVQGRDRTQASLQARRLVSG